MTYTKIKKHSLWFTLCLLFGLLVPAGNTLCVTKESSKAAVPGILVLHSYYPTFTWSDNITQGIQKFFEKEGEGEAHVYTEFLDAKRHPEAKYLDRVAEVLKIKYPDTRAIDIIICSDDQALNFLLDRTDTLFTDIPVVFCGVNGYDPHMRELGRPLTGVIEAIDPKSTLEAALNLQPNTREVLVINDITLTGQAIENMARRTFQPFRDKLRFRYMGDMSMNELKAEVSGLSKDAIVFLFVFNRDNKGRDFTHEASLRYIAEHCKVPIYSTWTFYLGQGIVGGMLTSGEIQGRTAAQLALRILRGERAEDIPVIMKSPNQYMFDNHQLALHHLPLDRLPRGSKVINRPVNFYQKYRYHIWASVIALTVQTVIIIILLFNVSRRRHAEKKLISSEERYRSLVETLTDFVFIIDTDGKFTYLNPEFERVAGYTVRDFLGHPFTEILAPQYIESTVARFKQGLKGETIPVYEVEIKKRDGTTLPVELKVTSLLDADGRVIGRTGVARDISERKHTEKKIRENELFLQSVFDGMQDGISILDREFNIVRVNPWIERLHADLMPLVGKKCYEAFRQRETPCPWCPCVPCLEDGTSRTEIVSTPAADGTSRWIELTSYPLKDINGDIKGIIEHVKDINDRRIAEEKIRKSEKRFRDLFDSITDLIYTQDMEGRFLSANRALTKTFGYEEKEILGKKASDFMKPELRALFEREYLTRLKMRGYYEGITSYFRKDGKEIYIEYRSTRVMPEDGKPYISGTGRDVTERVRAERQIKKLQEQMIQAKKMEAIGVLAGGIAHDFNNLLMGIQGNASLMLLETDSGDSDYEKLKNIEQYVRRGADLTKQLLGFARGGRYEVKPTDLNELVKSQNRMFGRTKKEIKIHGKYEKEIWTVEVDQGQIEQVLLNLYINAWQAMPGGGELFIQTENIILDKDYVTPFGLEPGGYVKTSVTDTGVGMDEATRQRIFDPFFTTKEMGRGTGLGLASAYGIIHNHGGIINVYSEKGEGTTFNIYLPAAKSDLKIDSSQAADVVPQQGDETILLVDDENMILDVGRQILNKLGYKVFTAESGRQAIEIYRENREGIHLIILDMIMPDISGGATFDRLKEIKPDIKVLLSSGYSLNGQAKQILERGCKGFIQKPFNMEQMSRKIREILDKK